MNFYLLMKFFQMTKNQIYNLFNFCSIWMDQRIEYTSIDYILEKYNRLIGVVPYSYLIKEPNKIYKGNWSSEFLSPLTKKEKEEYYRFLNILNFIENFNFRKHPNYNFKVFKRYIGEINNINDNSYYKTGIHPVMREYTESYLKEYERFIKLLTL